MNADEISNKIYFIYAELNTESLSQSLTCVYELTPRPWLAIRKILPHLEEEVLYLLLDALQDVTIWTEEILNHSTAKPTLTDSERTTLMPDFYHCIRGRMLVISMLSGEIKASIDGNASPSMTRSIERAPTKDKMHLRSKIFICKILALTNARSTSDLASCVAKMCTQLQPELHGTVGPSASSWTS